MTKYKVKNISCDNSKVIQHSIKGWLETRKHINIISTNIWCDEDTSYATIIYTEKRYNL